MPELTASTREAARRLGVSDTAIHKAEQAGRIAREPDGSWDIYKTRRRLTETADPVRSPLAMPTPQRLSTCGGAKPEGSTTAGGGGGAAGAVVAGMPSCWSSARNCADYATAAGAGTGAGTVATCCGRTRRTALERRFWRSSCMGSLHGSRSSRQRGRPPAFKAKMIEAAGDDLVLQRVACQVACEAPEAPNVQRSRGCALPGGALPPARSPSWF